MTQVTPRGLMPVADALAFMGSRVGAVQATERVPLSQALERIAAEPVLAARNVPPQDNSAMDGYALRAQDAGHGKRLRIVGRLFAGQQPKGELAPGTCVRIMTGAPIPAGADCVVMQENVELQGNQLRLCQGVREGENIRPEGGDIRAGSQVINSGRRLGPIDIALLASLGVAELAVFKRLRVAVLSTGDELTAPGQPLLPGHIYDSNRYGIIALLQRLAVEVVDLGMVPDQPEAIASALARAAREADALVSSGGVSVGEADLVKEVIAQLGQIEFWKVAIKPGKPFAFGKFDRCWFFGVPGNPVSAMVALHQLAMPILRQMAGEQVEQPLMLRAKAAATFKKQPGRADYQRGRFVAAGEGIVAHSTGNQSSGVLTSFSHANCYALLEQDRGDVAEGEDIAILPFDRFLI